MLLCALALGLPAAAAASMKMTIGAAEDEGRNADATVAQSKVVLAKAAGFEALRVTAVWTPGQRKVPADELQALQSIANAGFDNGVTIYATIMPFGSRTTPLTDTARSQFAAWAADFVRRTPRIRNVIIGNEPNINRYWLPQFGPNGEDVAAQQYELLLARAYDAIKKVDRKTFVIGGSVHGKKVHGKWPGLEPEQLNEGRDLALTTDFRSIFSEVAFKHLGAAKMDAVFPGFNGDQSKWLGVL